MNRSEYSKKWRAANPDKVIAQRKRDREYRRKWGVERRRAFYKLIAEMKQLPCVDCNVMYPPWVMDFDHVYGKSKPIAQLAQLSIDSVLAELIKCDVVCSNCHRQRTHLRGLENGTRKLTSEVVYGVASDRRASSLSAPHDLGLSAGATL